MINIPTPPTYSVVDSCGNRTILLAIDIMVAYGQRFFCTFRYKAPVHPDVSLGYVTELGGLEDALYERYPSLKNRDDVRICLADAKPIRQLTNHDN